MSNPNNDRSEIGPESEMLENAMAKLLSEFSDLPEFTKAVAGDPKLQALLSETAERLGNNYPYFHPLYAGQMLKPPHQVARLAYALALMINPNNHAYDGGRASSIMEKEAVAEIARMFDWQTHLGHLCSGGTMANLEALWISRQVKPGLKIAASDQAHFTHERVAGVLNCGFVAVDSDEKGRMNPMALEARLKQKDIGTVVATIGSTGTASVDPLEDILRLKARYDFRLHLDAAYGGYFILAGNLAPQTRTQYDLMKQADSICIDPHKHGLQPYGCGCVLFRDPRVGRFYKHNSPYTYFTSADLHLGEITLECSRPGSSAVALWATQKYLPLIKGGAFATILERCRSAALKLHTNLQRNAWFLVPFEPELDIVVWAIKAGSVSQASQFAREIFEECAQRNLHLALANLPARYFDLSSQRMEIDQEKITCLRSVLMKPEHLDWVNPIYDIISAATEQVLKVSRAQVSDPGFGSCSGTE